MRPEQYPKKYPAPDEDERGYDVVVDSANTIYFKPGLDITNDAIAAYDKTYQPAAQ